MRILITGAAGYLGSSLAKSLEIYDLTLVDNYSADYDSRPVINEVGRHKILKVDISESDACDYITKGQEIVFHLAAIPGIARCESPDSYINNVSATTMLAKWAEKNGARKIIFASTSAVYGESQSENITESHRIYPRCRYGWQKYASEIILQSSKVPTVILRKSNCYGDGFFHKNVAADIFIDKVKNKEPIKIDGNGQQRRDYLHIDDTIEAYRQAIYWDRGIYNIGGNDNLSINELADLVISVSDSKIEKIYDSESKTVGRLLKKFVYNCEKARAAGFQPKKRVEDEIRKRLGINSNYAI